MGDETGLLLTLGNYHSTLTYFVVVAVIAVSLVIILLTTRRKELEYDVFSLGSWERMVYVGLAIIGTSFLPIAAGFFLSGALVLALGVAVTARGALVAKKSEGGVENPVRLLDFHS